MTQLAFVIGHPIGHSMSPIIHNAAFAALDLDAHYEAVDLLPEDLASWVADARRPDFLGFSVTVPHKETVARLVDVLEGDARLAGAVSAVVVSTERGVPCLVGMATDTVGFRRSLAEEAGLALTRQRVVVLGAGGAARAVALVALQDEATELVVVNRHRERGDRLLLDLEPVRSATTVRAISLDDESLPDALARATVVVNATSVGMRSEETPVAGHLIHPGSLVVDLVYNPLETVFLRSADRVGARILGGLGTLVYQAAAAFERWTGRDAPIEIMRAAALGGLRSEV